MDNELLRAIDNIRNGIAPFWDLILVVAYILGIRAKVKYGQRTAESD
jgi:hypothetical protein